MIGALVTSLTIYLASGLLRWIPNAVAVVLVVGVAALLVGREARWLQFGLPQNHRQVPQGVVYYGGLKGFFQFGFEMGTCCRTYVTSTAPYILLAGLLLLSQTFENVLIVAVMFALGRWIVVVASVASIARLTRRHSIGTKVLIASCVAVLTTLYGIVSL